jgi:hypothetical protein
LFCDPRIRLGDDRPELRNRYLELQAECVPLVSRLVWRRVSLNVVNHDYVHRSRRLR